MNMNQNDRSFGTSGTWLCMVSMCLLLMAGCATDKKQDRAEQGAPDGSAESPQKTGPSVDESPKSTPKARQTPRTAERTQKPPAQSKKTPPGVQDQARKSPPPAPAREESKEAAKTLPPVEPHIEQPRTDTPGESKAQQQAKIPGDRVTPLDQSGHTDDIEITRRIRQKLMNEDLSFLAKNVMVITEADRVVLKGIVGSQSEAERVKGVAGALTTKQIEDRLQISGQ